MWRPVMYPTVWLTNNGCGNLFSEFITVVLNNLEEAKLERLEKIQREPTREEILNELRSTQDALVRLQRSLDQGGERGLEQRRFG